MGIYSLSFNGGGIYVGTTIETLSQCGNGGERPYPSFIDSYYWSYTGSPPTPNTVTATQQFSIDGTTYTNFSVDTCPFVG